MIQYRTKDGDMLDNICFKHYGGQIGATEAVYEANRGLADIGPVLPAGMIIDLPELPAAEPEAALKLWD